MSNFFRTASRYARPPQGSGLGFGVLVGGAVIGFSLWESLYTVNGGHRAVMFNKFKGVQQETIPEGTHVRIPLIEEPTIFDIRAKPKTVRSVSGTKDLQMVDVALRVLYRPEESALPAILSNLGTNYDDRVLPSIINETLKSVLAQFNASQLITKRETVSQLIHQQLSDRARRFHLKVDDVSITHLAFGKEYSEAVEAKQIAQQEAERARYTVKQAEQDKLSTIIKAQGEAKSIELIGESIKQNPGYLELRQLEAARDIATHIANGNSKVYLDSDQLLLNVITPLSGSQPSQQ